LSGRLDVRKTYKLFIGGAFPRSESARSYEVTAHNGGFLANASRASRKDVRDAVTAARASWRSWSGLTAYNRGQILYRVAEVMESRRAEFIEQVERAEGEASAERQVDGAIDTWVWYAGLTDKLAYIAGGLNPVAGPYFNITVPESTGVVGMVAPERPSLAGLVERLAPALCGGNTVVAVTSQAHPLGAMIAAECFATSDVPPGVVNLLSGHKDELVPVVASHLDIDALDVTGVGEGSVADAERAAAGNVKRIVRSQSVRSPYEATAFMELKTVWHPKGA
jgi:acyl-CoA reductase-like NAD-dependent aldehyde dehydrogenase